MWKKSLIIPLHKKKDKLNCDNYRGVSLLPHCGKVMAMVILQRIRKRTEEVLSEAQAGFRAGRSTVDQLFTLRRIAETYSEFSKQLYVCYVDFQKALDSVWRAGLWQVMRFLGYEEKIVRLLEALYQNTMSAVRVDGGLSEWFETVVGVMQGCVLSPLLFNLMLEVVIALALKDNEIGVNISGINISNLRFADDISLLAGSNKDLQQLVDKVYTTSNRFGLKASSIKTKGQCIGGGKKEIKIKLGCSDLTQCEQFVYLGGVISEDGSCDQDVTGRIGLAAGIVRISTTSGRRTTSASQQKYCCTKRWFVQ